MKALILLAHGSRDPAWPQAVEAVAARVRSLPANPLVACAYIEHSQPDVAAAAVTLAAQGATTIELLPVFIGAGRHVREDVQRLAQELRDRHPRLDVRVRPFLGDDPRFTALVAQLAVEG